MTVVEGKTCTLPGGRAGDRGAALLEDFYGFTSYVSGKRKKKKKAARYQNLSKSEVNGARPPELFFVGRSTAMQSSLKHMETSADKAWAVDADGLSARPRSVTTCIC